MISLHYKQKTEMNTAPELDFYGLSISLLRIYYPMQRKNSTEELKEKRNLPILFYISSLLCMLILLHNRSSCAQYRLGHTVNYSLWLQITQEFPACIGEININRKFNLLRTYNTCSHMNFYRVPWKASDQTSQIKFWCVCMYTRKRERECVCVCVRERERERESVCVCVCFSVQ